MNKIFTEFENENVLRSYPFASGCTCKDTDGKRIATGVFVDAALYPVNAKGQVFLSSIEPQGIVKISDAAGVIMVAQLEPDSSELEFYDLSGLSRHVGTITAASADALASVALVNETRKFKKKDTTFAASGVFPVVNDGVLSIDVNDAGPIDGEFYFGNAYDEEVRVSTTGTTLRFDVLPDITPKLLNSIKHIYCIVDGKTPFRIQKIPFGYDTDDSNNLGNTVAVYLDNIDRDDICAERHRENAYEMTDTCEDCNSSSSCYDPPTPPKDIPDVYQVEVVDIPNGAENAFYLAVPNFIGYNNPLSITMSDGLPAPKLEIKITEPTDSLEKFEDEMTAKGVTLQVPGLGQ